MMIGLQCIYWCATVFVVLELPCITTLPKELSPLINVQYNCFFLLARGSSWIDVLARKKHISSVA